jgi:hypothetical protein
VETHLQEARRHEGACVWVGKEYRRCTLLRAGPPIADDPLDALEGWEDRLVTASTFDEGVSQLFTTLKNSNRVASSQLADDGFDNLYVLRDHASLIGKHFPSAFGR